MSAPLLGVDKELKKKVPPPRATSGMPIFSWEFNKGCVLILSSLKTVQVSHFLNKRCSCPIHTIPKSPLVLIILSTWSMEISEAL